MFISSNSSSAGHGRQRGTSVCNSICPVTKELIESIWYNSYQYTTRPRGGHAVKRSEMEKNGSKVYSEQFILVAPPVRPVAFITSMPTPQSLLSLIHTTVYLNIGVNFSASFMINKTSKNGFKKIKILLKENNFWFFVFLNSCNIFV